MKIEIVTPTWPPSICGIGDYTYKLAEELSHSSHVTILTAQEKNLLPLSGVDVKGIFRLSQLREVRAIADHVAQDKPDWLLLQYNPFSFEMHGLNFYLPLVIRTLRRQYPKMGIAVMVHEAAKIVEKPSHLVSTLWVHWSLWTLGRAAHVVLFSIDAWAVKYRSWFPKRPVLHLPVGANIAEEPISRHDARTRLGIAPETVVLGLFGRVVPSLSIPALQEAVRQVQQTGKQCLLLYIGTQGQAVSQALPDVPILAEGPLPAQEVSCRFRAMDIFLLPFVEGISTRRTSLVTGLQHGIPTVTTNGVWTDQMLRVQNNKALILTPCEPDKYGFAVKALCMDDAQRQKLGLAGRQLYEESFTWKAISNALLSAMKSSPLHPSEI